MKDRLNINCGATPKTNTKKNKGITQLNSLQFKSTTTRLLYKSGKRTAPKQILFKNHNE